MISLTTFITLLAHFNDLKRRVEVCGGGGCRWWVSVFL